MLLSVMASVSALLLALGAQLGLDMQPCQMCIYQRIPFVIVAFVGMVGLLSDRGQVGAWHSLCLL